MSDPLFAVEILARANQLVAHGGLELPGPGGICYEDGFQVNTSDLEFGGRDGGKGPRADRNCPRKESLARAGSRENVF